MTTGVTGEMSGKHCCFTFLFFFACLQNSTVGDVVSKQRIHYLREQFTFFLCIAVIANVSADIAHHNKSFMELRS